MDSSKQSIWEFIGEVVIMFLWLLAFVLLEFDFWAVVIHLAGGAV